MTMKSIARYLIPAAGLAVALPVMRADDPAPNKKEMRVLVAHGDDEAPDHPHRRVIRIGAQQELESGTFLGVETRPADSALSAQLNLAAGTGLIVRDVVPDSPASTALKKNDVLVKMDDQLLIEQRQLSVLIRSHKEGDEITLTYIRGGKEATAKVKLVKHDFPRMAMMEGGLGNMKFQHLFNDDDTGPGMDREDMDRVLALIDKAPGYQHRSFHVDREGAPGMRSTTVSVDNSNMVFSDEKGSLDLTIKDGKKTLVAKNAKGEQLYSGPVTTPDERKALPPEVRERLDKLEGMQDFSFQTDEAFEGGKAHIVKPGKTKITAPRDLPAPEARPHTPSF
ncbi:MAG: hypothetical protein JWM32_2231 [Verrucomicrobia bacterium]|nr:hypothetical protein [Verrucomicrobiota bacterium]